MNLLQVRALESMEALMKRRVAAHGDALTVAVGVTGATKP